VRRFLHDAGYSEEAIRERMGIRRLSESVEMHSTEPASDELDLLIQLFLLGEPVPEASAHAYLPEDARSAMTAMGLLSVSDESVSGAVALYPVRSLYLISDRNRRTEQEAEAPKVFSAISPNTEEFLAMLPEERCPAFLELCSGAGAAALIAGSQFATQAFAFDISERASIFAEFNRRLNELDNVTIEQGDLYAPAGRRTFDCIVAHPPYVPSLRSDQLFRDGGEDGERLTRRIIEGLPNYLHSGGRFYCLALLAQARGERVEDRIRRWLREAESEFDMALITIRTLEPAQFLFDNLLPGYAEDGDLPRWRALLHQRRIEAFLYVMLVLHRRAESGPVVTVRRNAGGRIDMRATGDLLCWKRACMGPDAATHIAQLRPVARAGVELRTRLQLENGGWCPAGLTYSVDAPFRFSYEGPSWVAEFLSRCGGALSCREHFDQLQHDGVIGSEVSVHEFLDTVNTLIRGGLLQMPALHK
jgi:hypothetical protein